MSCEHVQHYRESEDVAAHDEDEKEDLGAAKDLTSPATGHHFSCVCHVVDVGVGEFELADYEAGVGCEDAEAYDEDGTTDADVVSGCGQW